MATRQTTVNHILEQIGPAGAGKARKMFGEFGLYCDGTLVALVCDETLFVKPTDEGRRYANGLAEASPYPGAKPCLVVAGERWDDAEWLSELIRLTAAHIPKPTKKPRDVRRPAARAVRG